MDDDDQRKCFIDDRGVMWHYNADDVIFLDYSTMGLEPGFHTLGSLNEAQLEAYLVGGLSHEWSDDQHETAELLEN